jgi:hypothetical protein
MIVHLSLCLSHDYFFLLYSNVAIWFGKHLPVAFLVYVKKLKIYEGVWEVKSVEWVQD